MISSGRHTLVPEDVVTNVRLEFGAFCSIASGLRIVSGQHPGVVHPRAVSDFPFSDHGFGDYPESDMGEGVTIGNDVWIGEGVTILDGVYVGDGARVGAAAVVVKDVAPYSVVVGNPGQHVRARFDTATVAGLLRIEWWRWNDRRIAAALPDMLDAQDFVTKHEQEAA